MTEPRPTFSRPVPLEKRHRVAAFDCGKPVLNDFLIKYALQNQGGGSARTYVVLSDVEADGGRQVLAYYSLAPGSVGVDEVPERVAKGQPRHPIPVILMARFAVDLRLQCMGLGRNLFYDALARAVNAAESIGGRAFFVEAKDNDAEAFYRKFGMESAPTNPKELFLLFKDARKTLGLG